MGGGMARFCAHLLYCLAAILAGCTNDNPASPAGSATQSTLQRAIESGKLRIGYANEAPFAYMDSKSGRLTGEAPEIARRVLDRLGIDELEGVLTEFGALIPGLQAGRFDVIAAGMYVLPERCKQIAFSNPTYGIGQAFVVRSGNPKALHSYGDVVNHANATLGVVAGAVERGYARSLGVPDNRVTVFPNAPSALAGVQAGRVDAYAATSLTVQDLISKAGGAGVERAVPFRDPMIDGESVRGYGAFGFRKADQAFADAFNAELAKFLGSEAHLELVRPFGFTTQELPGQVTTAELCQH